MTYGVDTASPHAESPTASSSSYSASTDASVPSYFGITDDDASAISSFTIIDEEAMEYDASDDASDDTSASSSRGIVKDAASASSYFDLTEDDASAISYFSMDEDALNKDDDSLEDDDDDASDDASASSFLGIMDDAASASTSSEFTDASASVHIKNDASASFGMGEDEASASSTILDIGIVVSPSSTKRDRCLRASAATLLQCWYRRMADDIYLLHLQSEEDTWELAFANGLDPSGCTMDDATSSTTASLIIGNGNGNANEATNDYGISDAICRAAPHHSSNMGEENAAKTAPNNNHVGRSPHRNIAPPPVAPMGAITRSRYRAITRIQSWYRQTTIRMSLAATRRLTQPAAPTLSHQPQLPSPTTVTVDTTSMHIPSAVCEVHSYGRVHSTITALAFWLSC